MRSRNKRPLAAEINVVPYIDVMLVLLIIFMVTAPLLTTGVQVHLPRAPAEAIGNNDATRINLTVNSNGQMFLNVSPTPDKPISPDKITRIVGKILTNRPKTPVVVSGAGSASYKDVVRGMVLLQSAGATEVGLLTNNVNNPSSGGDAQSGDSK